MIKKLITEHNHTILSLSKAANVPYSTLRELVVGDKDIHKCNIRTVKAVADVLSMSIDDLYSIWKGDDDMVLKKIPVGEIEEKNARDKFSEITDFIGNSNGKSGRLVTLYGLRRTGKTTLMKQLAKKYGVDHIYEVMPDNTVDDMEKQIDEDRKAGNKVIFLDEVTDAKDFASGAAILADFDACSGIDVVIAGTDSLGLLLAEDEELFDRVKRIETTYIPFSEHCRVLGKHDMDEYIEYGGLMRRGITDGEAITDIRSARRYLDSAVAGNIARSLKRNPDSPKYRELRKHPLADIQQSIRKVVEIYNGYIGTDMLNAALSKVSIDAPIADHIKKTVEFEEKERYRKLDRNSLREQFKQVLNLSCNLELEATNAYTNDLRDALMDLDLLSVNKTVTFVKEADAWLEPKNGYDEFITMPAIKYHHLIEAKRLLMESEALTPLTQAEREALSVQLTNDIHGKISETVVLNDTRKILDDRYLVMKVCFKNGKNSDGEYDMMVYDTQKDIHYDFEIKHSKEIVQEQQADKYIGQDKNLINDEKSALVNSKFGKRGIACVLYNGKPAIAEHGTCFINMADFLIALDRTKDMEKALAELLPSREVRFSERVSNAIESNAAKAAVVEKDDNMVGTKKRNNPQDDPLDDNTMH